MIVNVYALYESQLLGQVKSNGRGSHSQNWHVIGLKVKKMI